MIIPPGFNTVAPYLIVEKAVPFLDFLVQGLGGTEILRHPDETGRIRNAQVRLGTSTVMVGEATSDYPPTLGSYYLYVENADAAMQRAIGAGAVEIMEVSDKPYGDRQGGVRDLAGNMWWLSQRLVEGPY